MRHSSGAPDPGQHDGDRLGDAPAGPAAEYLERLSSLLGAERTTMIRTAWSGSAVPAWLKEQEDAAADTPYPRVVRARRRQDRFAVIRQTTMLCVTAALGSCLFLYWGKSQATMSDREIGRVIRATQEAHNRVYALRAEWALLNRPDRLQDMAAHYLALRPIAPTQFSEVARLPDRLQAPVAPPPEGSEDTALADASDVQAPAIRQASVVSPALPDASDAQPPAPAPAVSAAAQPGMSRAAPAAIRPDVDPTPDLTTTSTRMVAADEPAAPAMPAEAPAGVRHEHRVLARVAAASREAAPLIAETREPVRVRESGEALLEGPQAGVHPRPHVWRASAYAALPPLVRAEPMPRIQHRMPAARIDLPHWLTESRQALPPARSTARSDPPHTLSLPQGVALPLATPQPDAAVVQRAMARAEPEHPALVEAPSRVMAAPYERPSYRNSGYAYGYGNPYRRFYGSPNGGYYGGTAGPYGGYPGQYGGYAGYGRAMPPPGPGPYYQ